MNSDDMRDLLLGLLDGVTIKSLRTSVELPTLDNLPDECWGLLIRFLSERDAPVPVRPREPVPIPAHLEHEDEVDFRGDAPLELGGEFSGISLP